jgi:hypothetical protein
MDFLLDLTVAHADRADRLRQADAARRALEAAASPTNVPVSGRWPATSTVLTTLAGVWSLITATSPRPQ